MPTLDDIADLVTAQGDAFAAFRKKNDDRLRLLEDEATELAKERGREKLWGGFSKGDSGNYQTPEQKSALTTAVRALLAGDQPKWDRYLAESKGMSAGSDLEGGYAVLPHFSAEMTRVAAEISPLSRLARTVNLDRGDTFEEIIDRDQAVASWVAELDARSETAAPDLGLFRATLEELQAMPKASQKLIDTSSIDVVAWLSNKVAEAFALAEGAAFHTGNGVSKPRGFLDYDVASTSDATRPWGTLQYVVTGASGAFPTPSTSVNSADCLQDVVSALKVQYRNNAAWLMNRETAGLVRKLKDADGRWVWLDSLVAGQPSQLLGYPVELSEDMPAIGANSYSIAFGDFKRAYTIIRRLGTRFLVDPYSNKPNVLLYAFARVGGGVNNSEAVKLLKFGTS